MNTETKPTPTPGAMRAAVRLPENSQGWPIENLAEIIDRETSLPALIAALEELRGALRIAESLLERARTTTGRHNYADLDCDIAAFLAALAKAKGGAA